MKLLLWYYKRKLFTFFLFYFFYSSLSAASSYTIPAEMNITHHVAMMEWKNEKKIRNRGTFLFKVQLGEKNSGIINDSDDNRLDIATEKEEEHTFRLRMLLLEDKFNEIKILYLKRFLKNKNIFSYQEILIQKYKLIIDFFTTGLVTFLYYSDEGKIEYIQLIRINILDPTYQIVGIILTDNAIQFHCENSNKETLFITGEIPVPMIESQWLDTKKMLPEDLRERVVHSDVEYQWLIMKNNFRTISQYWREHFFYNCFDHPNGTIRIPFETVVMLSDHSKNRLQDDNREIPEITDKEVQSIEADEPLLLLTPEYYIDESVGYRIPSVITKIIFDYISHVPNIIYQVTRLQWQVENNHEGEPDQSNGLINFDVHFSGVSDTNQGIMGKSFLFHASNRDKDSKNMQELLRKRIVNNIGNKIIIQYLKRLRLINTSSIYQEILLIDYNFYILLFQTDMIFMHYSNGGKITSIFFVDVKDLFFRCKNLHIVKISIDCNKIKFLWEYNERFLIVGKLPKKNDGERYLNEFNVLSSYLHKTFGHIDKKKDVLVPPVDDKNNIEKPKVEIDLEPEVKRWTVKELSTVDKMVVFIKANKKVLISGCVILFMIIISKKFIEKFVRQKLFRNI